MSKVTAVKMEIEKEIDNFTLKIQVVPEIENFFSKVALGSFDANDAKETSEKWKDINGNGLVFYKTTPEFSAKIRNNYKVFNNFGSGLLDNSDGDFKANIAVLRAVGVSNGIVMKLNEQISLEEVQIYTDLLADFCKAFYRDYLMSMKIRAKISIEN